MLNGSEIKELRLFKGLSLREIEQYSNFNKSPQWWNQIENSTVPMNDLRLKEMVQSIYHAYAKKWTAERLERISEIETKTKFMEAKLNDRFN